MCDQGCVIKAAWFCALLLSGCGSSHSIKLPAGVTEIHKEWNIPEGARDVEVIGAGSTLRAAQDFRGRAIFTVKSAARIRFRDFTIEGNRDALEQRAGLPGSNTPFRRHTLNNGILIEDSTGIGISNVSFRQVGGFAILVSAGRQVRIAHVRIEDSGSRNADGRNNTTGGILLEEGSSDFQVLDCEFKYIRGNGVWTHSL